MKTRLILLLYIFSLILLIISKKNEEKDIEISLSTFSADYAPAANGEIFMKKRIVNNTGKKIAFTCFQKDSATGEWKRINKVLENEEYFIAYLKR